MKLMTEIHHDNRFQPVQVLSIALQQFQFSVSGHSICRFHLQLQENEWDLRDLQIHQKVERLGTALGEFAFRKSMEMESDPSKKIYIHAPSFCWTELFRLGYRVIESEDEYQPYGVFASRSEIDYSGFFTLWHRARNGDQSVYSKVQSHPFYATAKSLTERQLPSNSLSPQIQTPQEVISRFKMIESVNEHLQNAAQNGAPVTIRVPLLTFYLPEAAVPGLKAQYFSSASIVSGVESKPLPSSESFPSALPTPGPTPLDVSVPSISEKNHQKPLLDPSSDETRRLIQNLSERLASFETKCLSEFLKLDRKVSELKQTVETLQSLNVQQKSEQEKAKEKKEAKEIYQEILSAAGRRSHSNTVSDLSPTLNWFQGRRPFS